MAYEEIPRDVEYEEELWNTLTVRQAIYLVGVPAGIVGLLFFKLHVPPMIVMPIGFALFLIGVGFAYFEWDEIFLNVIYFYSRPRELGYPDPRLSDLIFIKEIRDDVIILKDGQKRAILQVKPINFATKSVNDQTAILETYKKFLYSLTYPTQIYSRSSDIINDLKHYFASIETKIIQNENGERREKLLNFFHDFRDYYISYVQEASIRNRLFYLIIPAPTSNLRNKEERELDEIRQVNNRIEITKQKLSELGLASERLRTNKLISLLASHYEGHVEFENDYSSPIIVLKKYVEETNGAREVEKPILAEN